MKKAYTNFSTRETPQSEPIPGSNQVQNNAGGFAWAIDDWKRLDRFLILGSEGGTYYVKERELTKRNALAVMNCIQEDGARAVNRIVEISEAGRAPKNDPALFALAMAAGLGDAKTRQLALENLPRVARIGTHLFHFVTYVEQFRGWGRGLRSAVARWYNAMNPEKLAYQAIKYQQRDGWSHRDLLRLVHLKGDVPHNDIYQWIVKGWSDVGPCAPELKHLQQIWAFEKAKRAENASEIINLITDYQLPREAIPTQFLNDVAVWNALLVGMPLGGLLRNLGKMTSIGLIKSMTGEANYVVQRLTDQDNIRKSRLHPLDILVALGVYGQGHGDKGSLSWTPTRVVLDALDEAFYLAFGNVEPTNKRIMKALDLSGSMTWHNIAKMPGITPRVASAALCLVSARVEPQYMITGFTCDYGAAHMAGIHELSISPRQRLDDVIRYINRQDAGGTDCSLPMKYALANKLKFDLFEVYTDNETWYGNIHPAQALRKYREQMGIPAKLVVIAMESTGFSIADPNDAGMLDIAGLDTAVPNIIHDFAVG